MSYYPRSSSSSSCKRIKNNFYTKKLQSPPYTTPRRVPIYQPRRTYTTNYKSQVRNTDDNSFSEKSINIFRSKINKLRTTPFYTNEKSLRIQDEIDYINKIVSRKTKVNKLCYTNTINNIKNNNEASNLLRSKIKLEQFDNIKNEIANRNIPTKFNYIGTEPNYKENNPYIFNTNKKYKRKGLFSSNAADYYNHKTFMNEMINFKNNNINKWRIEFNKNFGKY